MSRSGRNRGPVPSPEDSAAEPVLLRTGPPCPPCAICGHGGRALREQRHLTHGISVWLCDAHRSEAFMNPGGGTRLRRTTLCRVGGVRGPHGSQTRRARGSRSPCPDGEGRTPSTGVVLVADVASRSRATLCRGRTTGPSHLRAAPDLPRRSGDGPLAAHHASMVQPGTLACASVNRPPRAIAAAGTVGPGEPILAPTRRPAHHRGGVSLHDLPTPRTATWTLTSTGRQARSRRIARGSPSNTCSSWWTPPNGAP